MQFSDRPATGPLLSPSEQRHQLRHAAVGERRKAHFFARILMGLTGKQREQYKELAVKSSISSRRYWWQYRTTRPR